MTYTINQISKELDAAYAVLMAATERVFNLTNDHSQMHRELVEARQKVILDHAEDPKALGSNETARNAAIDALTVKQRQNVQDVDDSLREARHKQEIARMEVELWRSHLRCAEVEVAAHEHGGMGFVAQVR